MPLAPSILVGAALAALLAAAALAPAPRCVHRRAIGLTLAGGIGLLTAGVVILGQAAIGAATALLAAASWLTRAATGGPDDDGGDEPADRPDPPAPDWDDFDRLRDRWARTRGREPVSG